MRASILLWLLAFLAAPASGAPDLSGNDPHWILDPTTGCWAADPDPEPGESISWSGGPCPDDLASGLGTITWYRNGRITGADEGTFKAGELFGHGRVATADGSLYEGDFPGTGTITLPDGTEVPARSIKETAGWSIEEVRPGR
jgi:hypothetical protein